MAAVFGAYGVCSEAEVQQMGDRLSHRGSECRVAQVGPRLILGVRGRRSAESLMDVRAGAAAACDCLIFNQRELRGSLRNPKSGSDAALLLDLLLQKGVNGLDLVNGEFACVLFDGQQLWLGRDYVGNQPLYYSVDSQGTVWFASEYKALLATGRIPAEPDLDALQHLQHTKLLPIGRSLLRGVSSVPPGTCVHFHADGTVAGREPMPVIPLAVRAMPEDEARRQIASAYLEAMRVRTANPAGVGLALSGGIDSISMACVFRKLHPDAEIHTITAGWGPDDPEVQTAARVATILKTIHHEVFVTPETVGKDLTRLVWHLEDPIARSETLQLYEVGRAAAPHVDVLLTGSASDGIFAGMPKHKILWMARKYPFLKRPLEEFYHLTQMGKPPVSPLGRLLAAAYYRGKLPSVPRVRGSRFEPEVNPFGAVGPEFINSVMQASFQSGLGKWAAKVERPLAAWGLQHTSPFYDKNLIRAGFSIPSDLKIRNGQEKYILRQALRSLVPDEVLNIPKFPMRMKYDVAFADALDWLAEDALAPERLRQRGLFEAADIARLRRRKSGQAYGAEGAMRLWTVIATEIWARLFLDQGGAAPPAG